MSANLYPAAAGSMDTQGFENPDLMEVLYPKNGWRSLQEDFPDSEMPTAAAVFNRYVRQLSQASLVAGENEAKDTLRQKVMRRTLRDLYMAYAILNQESKVAELLRLTRVLSEEVKPLYEDINAMLESGFDPCWKVSTYAFNHRFNRNEEYFHSASSALDGLPDTIRILLKDLRHMNPLLRYRTVHHLNLWKSSLQEHSKTLIKVRRYSKAYVDQTSEKYRSTIYHAVLLTHHQPLIDAIPDLFNLFFQNEDGSRIDICADKLIEKLIHSDKPTSSRVNGYLKKIRRHVSHFLFPPIPSPDLPKDPPKLQPRLLEPPPIAETNDETEQQVLREYGMVPLSVVHSKELLNLLVAEAARRYAADPEALVRELFAILVNHFKNSGTKQQLLASSPLLVHHIHLALNDCLLEQSRLENSWVKLFKGELTGKQMQQMLWHLNMECVRKYRSLNSYGLCANIKKFLSPEEHADRFQYSPREQSDAAAECPASTSQEEQYTVSKPALHLKLFSKTKSAHWQDAPIGLALKEKVNAEGKPRSATVKIPRSKSSLDQLRKSSTLRKSSEPSAAAAATLRLRIADLDIKKMTSEEETPCIRNSPNHTLPATDLMNVFDFISSTAPLSHSLQQDQTPASMETASSKAASSSPDLIQSHELEQASRELSLAAFSIRITEAVTYHVLTAKDEKAAKKAARHAMEFAISALEAPVANYHVARSIFLAFGGSSLSRLKFLFDSLDSKSQRNYARLKEMFDPARNSVNYRTALKNSDRPYIPHIGMITSDLTFATENDFSEEQKAIVLDLLTNLEKSVAMMKIAVPLKPAASDSVSFLGLPLVKERLPQPPNKMDIKGTKPWKEGEWESLPNEEKSWYVSYQRWPKP